MGVSVWSFGVCLHKQATQAECLSLARSELAHFCSVIHPFSLVPAAAYIALEKLVWGAEPTENLYVALLVVCWFCSLNLVHFVVRRGTVLAD